MKNIESMVDKSQQETLVNDIGILQVVQNERIFIKASSLFIKKWIKNNQILWNIFKVNV